MSAAIAVRRGRNRNEHGQKSCVVFFASRVLTYEVEYLFVYILTHMLAERPDLRPGIDLYQHGRRADHEYAEIGDAQIHQEDVGAVPHVFAAQHDQRHLEE